MKFLHGIWMLGLGLTLTVGACNNNAAAENQSEEVKTETAPASSGEHGDGTAYNSAYVCPMHCAGSGSEEPGQCPVCGMDYIANTDHRTDGHKH